MTSLRVACDSVIFPVGWFARSQSYICRLCHRRRARQTPNLSWRHPFCWVIFPPTPLLGVGILPFNMFSVQLFETHARSLRMCENLCMINHLFIDKETDSVIYTSLCKGKAWNAMQDLWGPHSDEFCHQGHAVRWKAADVSEYMLLRHFRSLLNSAISQKVNILEVFKRHFGRLSASIDFNLAPV
jgi:hypothetical protein